MDDDRRSALRITGGKKLCGSVKICGAKNSVLHLMPLALLTNEKVILENVPNIKDIEVLSQIISLFGVRIYRIDQHSICMIKKNNVKVPPYASYSHLLTKMRSSIVLLGVLAVLSGQAIKFAMPGGCAIGARRINWHVDVLRVIGCSVLVTNDSVEATFKHSKDKKDTSVAFSFPSVTVGGTIHALLTAVLVPGRFVLDNCANEPEVIQLIDALTTMGACIGIKGRRICIKGGIPLKGITISVIPDRIEAMTYALIAAVTGSNIDLLACCKDHLALPLELLSEIGVSWQIRGDCLSIAGKNMRNILPINHSTQPYPGLPSDVQPLLIPLLVRAKGISCIEETIYEDRFKYLNELQKFFKNELFTLQGAQKLFIKGDGVPYMSNKPLWLRAMDLRGCASLLIQAVSHSGTTYISDAHKHLSRGYDSYVNKLLGIGADVNLIKLGVVNKKNSSKKRNKLKNIDIIKCYPNCGIDIAGQQLQDQQLQ